MRQTYTKIACDLCTESTGPFLAIPLGMLDLPKDICEGCIKDIMEEYQRRTEQARRLAGEPSK